MKSSLQSKRKCSYQNGIALIQVLLISTVITVFAIYLSQTARKQIQIAKLLKDRSEATVALHDAESIVFFNLLTKHPLEKGLKLNKNNFDKGLYYYGQSIVINANTTLKAQDLSGKLSAFAPEKVFFEALLLNNNVTKNESDKLFDVLLDWQDTDKLSRLNGAEKESYLSGPRNSRIPFLEEFKKMKGVTSRIYKLLEKNLTEVPAAGFNPIVATEDLLKARYPDVASEIIALRNQGNLTPKFIQEITNVEANEFVRFFPSNRYRLKFEASNGNVTLTKSMDIELNLYAHVESPLKIFSVKWNSQN